MEPRPLGQRLAAAVALAALIAAGALSAWWIVSDRADFRGLLDRPAAEGRPDPSAP